MNLLTGFHRHQDSLGRVLWESGFSVTPRTRARNVLSIHGLTTSRQCLGLGPQLVGRPLFRSFEVKTEEEDDDEDGFRVPVIVKPAFGP